MTVRLPGNRRPNKHGSVSNVWGLERLMLTRKENQSLMRCLRRIEHQDAMRFMPINMIGVRPVQGFVGIPSKLWVD